MSLMNIGVSALTANQQALNTTGHNIANVNTTGYSRQTLHTEAVIGQNLGFGFVGRGTLVTTVTRNYSELLNRQSNAATAAAAADSSRLTLLRQMQDVFTGGDDGLGAAINSVLNAFVDVRTAPTDASGRNAVLTRISELTARFRSASSMLQEQDYLARQQLDNNVKLVNQMSEQVAALNERIGLAMSSGHQPNDLLDAREQIVREINQYIQTSQVTDEMGRISLFVGGGHALVLGNNSRTLEISEARDYPGSQKMVLNFQIEGGQKVELSPSMMGGGEIAGLLKFKNEDLVEATNLLGRLALAIGQELNDQNHNGLTLNGTLGSDLFFLGTTNFDSRDVLAFGSSNITGYSKTDPTRAATVEIKNAAEFKPSDYKIVFESPDVRLVRMSDSKSITLDPSNFDGAGNIDIEVDGLRFFVPVATATAAQPRQSILFQPYSQVAERMQSLAHNPDELAASNAVSASIDVGNQGTLQMTALSAKDATDIPAQGAPVTITFNTAVAPATGYTYTSASGSGTYVAGEPIEIDGWTITLTGAPQDGDTVTVSNALDLGDGYKLNAGNAVAFMDLRDKPLFDTGTTLSDGFSAAMAVVGTRVQSARLSASLSETVANSLEMERLAVSGVNLDEEAARLLQFQQAYQASSKLIQISQTLFDTVLSAVGR